MRLFRDIIKARWNGLLRLRKATGKERLDCIGGACGLCCSVFGGAITVTPEDAKKLPSEFYVRSADGTARLKGCASGCLALKDRACTIHPVRPRACRDYPFYNVGGQLFVDIGCPGLKRGEGVAPMATDIAPLEQYLPTVHWGQRVLIALLKRW